MSNERTARLFEAWLESEAPTQAPEGLLHQIDSITGAIRPRPAWLARLEGHHMDVIVGGRRTGVPRLGLVLAVLGLLVATVAAAVIFGSRPAVVVAPTASPAAPTASGLPMRPIQPGGLIPDALIGDWSAYEFNEYVYYRRAGDPWCVNHWRTTQDCLTFHDGRQVIKNGNIVTLVDGRLQFAPIGGNYCVQTLNLVDFVISGDEVTLTVLPGQCFTDMSSLRRIEEGQLYPTLPPS